MRYDNIIWDFDGTLFNTYPAMCRDLQQVMKMLGVQAPLEDLLSRFTVSRETVLDWCGRQAGLPAREVDRIYRAWVTEHGQPEAHPFPYVREFLEKFHTAGGRNFIFTHRSGSVHDYLAREGLTEYFTDVVSAGTTYARKPAPAGNLYLIGTYALDRERTLAVGDRELDILAAKGAGIYACLFDPELPETKADYRIRALSGLDALVGLEN